MEYVASEVLLDAINELNRFLHEKQYEDRYEDAIPQQQLRERIARVRDEMVDSWNELEDIP
ncbi:MAG: hypothetical protein ACXV2D_05250 [Halobacteriota archaeon]